MQVGIRELKARLSEYVDRAARGEVIQVTDRGIPRAVLMPLPAGDRIQQGLEEGWLVRESNAPPADIKPVRAPAGSTTTEILTEDRGS